MDEIHQYGDVIIKWKLARFYALTEEFSASENNTYICPSVANPSVFSSS